MWFVCGWPVKLCDPIVIHWPFLSALEMTSYIKRCINSAVYVSFILHCRPSVLDHSCQPNAVAVFSGTTLLVRCIRPISSGEPVSRSL